MVRLDTVLNALGELSKAEQENRKEEILAAISYAEKNGNATEELAAYNAFLAGIEFQKNRYKDPEKEYYGF